MRNFKKRYLEGDAVLFRKTKIILSMLALLLVGLPTIVSAQSFGGIKTTGTYDIPENFNFTVSDTCTGHDNFLQVSVLESGRFALYTKYTDIKMNPDLVYKWTFVDIYDENGIFQEELSFYTEQDLAIELTEESLNIYFFDSVLSYDFFRKVLSGYSIPAGEAIQSGLYASLRESEFDRGGWHYICKRALHGYTALTRENQQQKQVLVSFSGTGVTLMNTAFPALMIGIVGFLLYFLILKKHKKS